MSEIIGAGDQVALVEATDPQVNKANVVENVNDHTPEPVQPPLVEKAPTPPEAQNEGMAALGDAVAKLGTMVDTLTELVLNGQKDESPHSVPWTHRGGGTPTP